MTITTKNVTPPTETIYEMTFTGNKAELTALRTLLLRGYEVLRGHEDTTTLRRVYITFGAAVAKLCSDESGSC